ncbi:hypothetical protein JCM5353_002466 [Sporobolomyces roseus]
MNQTNATSLKTTIEVAGNHEIAHKVRPLALDSSSADLEPLFLPPQIDRLSLLPNELLDHIFDLAYSIDTPPTGALSKRLLPFHITRIYRRIFLTNPDNIAKLVRKIGEQSDLGEIVKMLHVNAEEDETGVIEAIGATEFEHFFRQLVRLESLDLGEDHYEWLDKLSASHNSASPIPLRHIRSAASFGTQPFVNFTSFRTLRSLHVTMYERNYTAFDISIHLSLPLLTHLTVSGTYADDLSIATFCSLCPSLTHLSLYAFEAVYVTLLQALPATLSRLELGTIDMRGSIGRGRGGEDCDLELSRFILLQSLSLDDDLFSSHLPSHLANLQHLASLKLVGDQIFYVDMSKLLSSPTRPPSLRVLDLCLDRISIGRRLEVDELGRSIGSYEPGENDWQVARDWTWPEYVELGKMYGHEEMYAIRKVAAQSGVEIRGSLYEALEMVDVYFLELANIAIYRCFRYSTLEPYDELQDRRLDSRLPPLDLESLDPNNLKLVQIDLPDEDWFALSLEEGYE